MPKRQASPIPVSRTCCLTERQCRGSFSRVPARRASTATRGGTRRAGRLRVSGGPAAIGAVAQKIDPAPYRGKLVRLKVTLRAIAPAQAGPFLTVLRPDPCEIGFVEDASAQQAPVANWQETIITGRIAQDATAIWIGVKAVGDVDLTIDDVRLEEARGRGQPPSSLALSYLD